jgi:hypothetical protein
MADVDVAAGEVAAHEVALTANTVKTIGFAQDLSEVKIINSVGTTHIYVHVVDSTNTRAATVQGKHCYQVPPAFPTGVVIPVRTNGNTLLSLISSGATTVSVSAT